MSKKNTDSPATTSLAYDIMLPTWRKVQTVLNGTESMRMAGEQYLPQHENESNVAYAERRDRCTLFNQTKLTLTSWVGKPFGEPIAFTEVPSQVEDYLGNVDLVGNNVHVFCRDWFADGVAKAYSHVLIDFPRTDPTPDGSPRSLADDQREGVRPYWVHIKPEQLIFANAEMIDGREILREVRIMESVVETVGFAEQVKPQIRRITTNPDPTKGCIVQLYRMSSRKKKGENEWVVFGPPYEMSLKEIPFVTFYADRDDFMLGTSPLADMADLNIAHWQSTSDQRAVLTVARFPILALSGAAPDKDLVIGPHAWLHSPDISSKFYYVEHTGAAIDAGREDLVSLENQMSEYGAQFLKKKPGNQTATARALDHAEATSPLQDMVMRFSFALSQALDITAKWVNLEDGGDAALNTKFSPMQTDQAMMSTLRETRKAKDISRKEYLAQLKLWGVIGEDYDAEADQLQIEQEQMDLFGAGFDPDPEGEGGNNADADDE